MRSFLRHVFLVAVFLPAGTLCGDLPIFGAPVVDLSTRRVLAMDDRPEGVAAGDFDEDGEPDIAAVHGYLSNGVVLFRGLGSGRFAPATSLTTTDRPFAVIVGDYNEDEHLDLAFTGGGPAALTVLLGDGAGGFGMPAGFGSTTRSDSLAAADINEDGHLDIAVSHIFTNSLSIYPGNGAGRFGQPLLVPVPRSSPAGVVAGDFNGDGHADLAVGVSTGCVVFAGDGGGGFGPGFPVDEGSGSTELAAADLNGDGVLDLAVVNRGTGTVLLLGGAGDGTFQRLDEWTVAPGVDTLALGDLNADGLPDLVIGGTGEQVHVLLGTGPGAFAPPVSYRAGGLPDALLVADLTRDGRMDVIAGNILGREVAILPGDGLGRLRAEISLPLAWSQTPDILAADFNEDGMIDLAALNSDGPFITQCGGGGAVAAASPLDCGPRMQLGVLPRAGPAAFGAPLLASTRCAAAAMAAADFNLDGHLDVATANRGARDAFGICFPASLSILLGDGRGGFAPPLDLEVPDEPDDVAAGDFTGDGVPDLVVAYRENAVVGLYRVDPGPVIVPVSAVFLTSGPSALDVGDLDGDGDLDVAVALPGSHRVAIIQGNGMGQLVYQTDCAPGTGTASIGSVAIGDFDGDAVPDIAAAGSLELALLHRSGNFFCLPGNTESLSIPAGAAVLGVHDVDNDGGADVLVGNGGGRLTAVSGGPPLAAAATDAFGAYWSGRLAIADFDDDGIADVAMSSAVGNEVSVVLNHTAAAPSLLLRLEESMIAWTGVLGALAYDIVAGDLATLRGSGGDFAVAIDACLANDVAVTYVYDPGTPAPGEGRFFVARPIFPSGPGSYDSDGPSQVAPRDPGINASSLACP